MYIIYRKNTIFLLLKNVVVMEIKNIPTGNKIITMFTKKKHKSPTT